MGVKKADAAAAEAAEKDGVKLQGSALYTEGPYQVFVGTVDTGHGDIPHYLIVNIQTNVVEGSAARLFEARGICSAYAKELAEQDGMLARGEQIVEPIDRPTSSKAKWGVN